MRRALFDPQCGYYARHIRGIGARGDFATSASLSPLLGKAIAGWLREVSASQPDVRAVIEIGGGDGSLMRVVRAALGWWQRRKFTFHMVEASPALREKQAALLGPQVLWHDSLEEALDAVSGRAFIYHNELLDALPVDLVQWDAGAQMWREIWINHSAEELRPLGLADASPFSTLRDWPAPPHDKQRCELHTGIRDWLRGWAPHWKRGAMLAIDYGGEFPAMYHRRPRGTLRAYLMHQRLEGAEVYQNIGRQDITADVNFTDLARWCREVGFADVKVESQSGFISAHAGGKARRENAAAHFITDDAGAGTAFKCLTCVAPGWRE